MVENFVMKELLKIFFRNKRKTKKQYFQSFVIFFDTFQKFSNNKEQNFLNFFFNREMNWKFLLQLFFIEFLVATFFHRILRSRFSLKNRSHLQKGVSHFFSLIMCGFCCSNALYSASLSFRTCFFFCFFLILKIVIFRIKSQPGIASTSV